MKLGWPVASTIFNPHPGLREVFSLWTYLWVPPISPHVRTSGTLYSLQSPPPPWGENRHLGPKSMENTRRQRHQRKFYRPPKAPKLIYTLILWYSFVVQFSPSPRVGNRHIVTPPPWGGEPSRHWWGDYKGGVRYILQAVLVVGHAGVVIWFRQKHPQIPWGP